MVMLLNKLFPDKTNKEWEPTLKAYANKKGWDMPEDVYLEVAPFFRNTNMWHLFNQSVRTSFKGMVDGRELTAFIFHTEDQQDALTVTHIDYLGVCLDMGLDKGYVDIRIKTQDSESIEAPVHAGINFEHRGFSEGYYVSGEPEKFGHGVFTPRVIEEFLKYKFERLIVTKGKTAVIKEVQFSKLQFNPQEYFEYIEDSTKYLQKMYSILPNYLKKKVTPTEEEPKEQEVKPRGTLSLECPGCGGEFKIPKGQKTIECPHCGITGEL